MGFWDVTPCTLIDGNVLYKPATSIVYRKMETGRSLETSVNEYQNIRRHIPEGLDFDTAG
jgi:hypothetical protein